MTRYLTVSEVCRQVRKSPGAVVRLIHNGVLPAVKIGRTYRINAADLDAFLGAARVRPRAEAMSPKLLAAVANHRHEAAERLCEADGI